jgi:hypothetical protein
MTIKWVNFRGSSGGPSNFPGDGPDSVRNLGGAYPVVGQQIGGVYDQGWGIANGTATDEDTFGASVHQAGYAQSTTALTAGQFRISGLTVGHTYNVYVSLGVFWINQANGFAISPTTAIASQLYDLPGGALGTSQIMDAVGATFPSPTLWLAGQSPAVVTATTADFIFTRSIASGNVADFNAIGIEDVTAVATAPASTSMMMGV